MNIKASLSSSSSFIILRSSHIREWVTIKGGRYLPVGLPLIFGAIFRLHRLGRDSYWLDEIDMITTASLPISQLFRALSTHASPPLDYLIMHYVSKLGKDESLIRLPAAIWSIFTIYLIFLAGKNLFSNSAGLSASMMLAFSLPSIAYSQEARMYSLAIALTTLLLITLSKCVVQPRNRKFWLLSIFFAILLVYTHYYGLLILFSVGLLWVIVSLPSSERKLSLISGLIGFIILALTFSLWLPTMITQSSIRGGVLSYALNDELYWKTVLFFLSGGIAEVYQIILLTLFSIGIFICIFKRPVIAGILLAFTIIPLFIAYLVPQLAATATPRNFLVFLPGMLITSSIGLVATTRFFFHTILRINSTKQHLTSIAIIPVILLVSIWPSAGMLNHFYNTGVWGLKDDRADWRQTSDYLKIVMRSGDLLLVNDRYTRYLLSFYFDQLAIDQVTLYDFVNNPDQITLGLERYVPVLTLEAYPFLLREKISKYNRTWVVLPDDKVLSEIGVKSDSIEMIDTGFNVPLSLIKSGELPDNLVISPLDSLYAFTEGWSSKVNSIDDQIVRAMSTSSSLTIPIWSIEHGQLILSYHVSPDVEGSILSISVKESVLARVPLVSGWQTTTINIPKELLINEDRIDVRLLISPLPAQEISWEIGRTGMKSPVSIIVESSGVENQPYSEITIDGKVYSWFLDGRGYGRGYTLIAVDPKTGDIIGYESFDTHVDESSSERMYAFIGNLPPNTIVAGAVKDDGGTKLTDSSYKALQLLGIQTDVRGHFRAAHAFIGVKGALPGTALEDGFGLTARVAVGKDDLYSYLALANAELTSSARK